MTTWTRVADHLPDDDTTVLIALSDGEVWSGYHTEGEWLSLEGGRMAADVTHWADMPEHPWPEKVT